MQAAGSTMTEIVASVQRVTDIIGEISAAAREQSEGIGVVNGSVVQLDQMTQQNAALVEESAAAAESLREQSARMAEAIAVFKLGGSAPRPTAPKAVTRAVHKPVAKPVSSPPTKPAMAPKPMGGGIAKPAAPARKAEPAPAPAPRAAAPAAPAAAPAADGDWETF
ncbi:hypothetical protein ASC81_23410 [Pelomonas sp. Root405]|nr:hypothetical protein ASC81_23410 [Pelomonas sp. Root405]